MSRGRVSKSVADRLWSRVDRSYGPLFCWPWKGAQGSGYGQIRLCTSDKRKVGAHVAAYMVTHDLTEPPILRVLHTCDTPLCCNPAHLWLGTAKENTADMIHKGRSRLHNGGYHAREAKRLRALVIELGGNPEAEKAAV